MTDPQKQDCRSIAPAVDRNVTTSNVRGKEMTKYKFDNRNINLSETNKRLKNGEYPTCPQCGEDLLVALDWNTASKADLHPGIYCPQNPNHVYISINIDKDKPFIDDTEK